MTDEEFVTKYAESLYPNASELLMFIGYLAKCVDHSQLVKYYGKEMNKEKANS